MSSPASDQKDEARRLPGNPLLRERDRRLESLKHLAGHLAHDFNNFLAPILGYLTLIKEAVPGDSPVLQYTDSMETAARRTEGLIETVMMATRPQRCFARARIDFTALIEREISQWEGGLGPTAGINVTKDMQPCTLYADPAQWRNVTQQLLRNARFALVTGGTLKVGLRRQILSPEQAADLGMAHTDVIQFTVEDTGFGMPDATLQRACEPFFTTRPKGQALGLGLTIAHSVTQLHGGQLLVDSAEDRGTTVTVYLPRVEEAPLVQPQVVPSRVATAPMQRRAGTKLLLVDDDPMVREVIKTFLQRTKYEIHAATDGVEALKLFRRYREQLALVISDVSMPNMNGVDLVLELRKLDAGIPIILISGDAEDKLEQALSRLGEQRPRLIKKPFALKDLVEAVHQHLG